MTQGVTTKRVMVAGVGNIFLADDGFGVEVARRLSGEKFPPGVEVEDYGIRGMHLAFQLLEGYDTLVLIDAVNRGDQPGTIFVIELDLENEPVTPATDAHSMNPEAVLSTLAALGGRVGRVLVVGCEPADLVERIGLSEVVSRAVDEAVSVVRKLIDEVTVDRIETTKGVRANV
ncbi:MAG TPA: hydrogenase maturation protease [Candidatus Acidoferrales bacterium]|jgi:hydrogenase maturation protease|nr:hydrogenase maturation protease [Candidatus Acidoferrales bacterium]